MSAVLNPAAAEQQQSLHIAPLAGRIGAEIIGLRLSGQLSPAVFAQLNQALLKHRVLFLRGQQHLDDAEHENFGRLFGPIEPHPTVPSPTGTKLFELDSQHGARANSWHTDVTFRVAPPKVAVLRAVRIPPVGGDTVWANTVAAYEGLPADLKALAEQLHAVHGNEYDYAAHRGNEDSAAVQAARGKYREVFVRERYESEHPVVTVHPETGEKALLLGHFVKRLVGHNSHDSQRLFEILHAQVLRLENTVRWRWTTGDVAIWDNRATEHYAINDYGDAHRVVRRVTVSGQPLVGADGSRSRVLVEPDASATKLH